MKDHTAGTVTKSCRNEMIYHTAGTVTKSCRNKMKYHTAGTVPKSCRNKLKYHTVGTVTKSNKNIVVRGNIDAPHTQIHDHSLSCLGTSTLIKRGGVKLVL